MNFIKVSCPKCGLMHVHDNPPKERYLKEGDYCFRCNNDLSLEFNDTRWVLKLKE